MWRGPQNFCYISQKKTPFITPHFFGGAKEWCIKFVTKHRSIPKLHLLKNLMYQSLFEKCCFCDWSVDSILTKLVIAYG